MSDFDRILSLFPSPPSSNWPRVISTEFGPPLSPPPTRPLPALPLGLGSTEAAVDEARRLRHSSPPPSTPHPDQRSSLERIQRQQEKLGEEIRELVGGEDREPAPAAQAVETSSPRRLFGLSGLVKKLKLSNLAAQFEKGRLFKLGQKGDGGSKQVETEAKDLPKRRHSTIPDELLHKIKAYKDRRKSTLY